MFRKDGGFRPAAPIPEPIRGAEPGTWAEDTITRRMPGILQRTIDENDFLPTTREKLMDLIQSIPNGDIVVLGETGAPDAEQWVGYIRPHLGANWLQVPWFFAEAYFYRRILSELEYFDRRSPYYQFDPYGVQKSRGLAAARAEIGEMIEQTSGWSSRPGRAEMALHEILGVDLWGNRGDLSIFPAGAGQTDDAETAGANSAGNLILDARPEALEYMQRDPAESGRVDMVLDNVGVELISDLCLADLLLTFEYAGQVRLHVKPYPMFVSDATGRDLDATLAWLQHDGTPGLSRFAERVLGHLRHARLQVTGESFWASPLSLWELPDALVRAFGATRLVIFKGDLNYRRVLGDRHWPFTTPFKDIIDYFPTAALALRTCKAELICGLEEGQADRLAEMDPLWMTDGDWGVIQFWAP